MNPLLDSSVDEPIGAQRNVATLLLGKLKQATETAKYARLKSAIKAAISSGELAAGDQLPPEAELAAALSLSLGTVRRCMAALVQEGVVKREHGRGTFIADLSEPLAELWQFHVLTEDGIELPIHTKQAMDIASDGVWVQQNDRIVHANQMMAELLGTAEPADLIGYVALDAVVSTDHTKIEAWFRQLDGSSGTSGRVRFRAIGLDGSLVDLEAVVLKTMWRQEPAILVAARDRTEQKQAEAALKEKEGEFRHLIEMMAEGALVHQDDQIVFVNNTGLSQFGTDDATALLGCPVFDLITPEDRPSVRAAIQQVYAPGGSTASMRFHGLRVDGQTLDLEASACRITWDRRPAILMMLREPIALKQAERALKESEERCRLILESLPAGVSILQDDRIVYANPAQATVFGVDDPGRLLGYNLLDFFGPEEKKAMHKRRHRVLATGRQAPFAPRQVLQPGGGVVDIESTASLISWNGEPAILGLCVDVTERDRMRAELRTSETRLQNILATAAVWLWETDTEHRFTFLSKGPDKTGFAEAQILGKTRWELAGSSPDDDPVWREYLANLNTRKPFHDFRYRNVGPDGEKLHGSVSGTPIFDGAGNFMGYRGTSRLIT